ERVEQSLAGATNRRQAPSRQPVGRVSEGGRRPIAGGGKRDRGHAAVDERSLLVEAERESEVDELRESAGTRRRSSRLFEDAFGRGPDEPRRWKARRVRSECEVRRASAGDRVEVDRGHDSPAERVVGGEMLR